MKKTTCVNYGFLILLGILLSCNRKVCENDNFYSTYQTRFQNTQIAEGFVKSDLELKQEIFSTLCISNKIKKLLIVECQNATESFYSRGLLYSYDDSKTYYYRRRDGKVIAGKGNNGYSDLNNILLKVRKDFSSEKAKLDKNYDDISDAPIVDVTLYDSLGFKKFDSFSFPSSP